MAGVTEERWDMIERKAQCIAELAADIQTAANIHTACARHDEINWQSARNNLQKHLASAEIRKRETTADATKTGIMRKTLLLRRELLKFDALIKG